MNIELFLKKGLSILDACNESSVNIPFACKRGVCGKCIIDVDGHSTTLTDISEIEKMTISLVVTKSENKRLACQCMAKENGTINFSIDNG